MHSFALSAHFTPEAAGSALLAGLMLGLTVDFKTGTCGGVVGLAGITTGFMSKPGVRKAFFIIGLVISGWMMTNLRDVAEPMPSDALPSDKHTECLIRYVVGGFLVGFGSSLGQGCMLSHCLTGLGSHSKRSLVAVVVATLSAILTATVSHTSEVVRTRSEVEERQWNEEVAVLICIACIQGLTIAAAKVERSHKDEIAKRLKLLAELMAGFFFGIIYAIAGMLRPSQVAAFIDLGSGAWDPTLAMVFIGGISSTLPFFYFLKRSGASEPLLGGRFDLPEHLKAVPCSVVVGSLLFGIGWGLTGMCPTMIWSLVAADVGFHVFLAWGFMVFGMTVWMFGHVCLARRPGPVKAVAAQDKSCGESNGTDVSTPPGEQHG